MIPPTFMWIAFETSILYVGDMGNGVPISPSSGFPRITARQQDGEEVLGRKAQRPRSSPGTALSGAKVRLAEYLGQFARAMPSREAVRALSEGGRVALLEGTREPAPLPHPGRVALPEGTR